MALVYDPEFNIMQQLHGLFAIAKLLVYVNPDYRKSNRSRMETILRIVLTFQLDQRRQASVNVGVSDNIVSGDPTQTQQDD